MNRYTISNAGIDFIKKEEGLRLKAYKDSVGKLTIGYGHTGKDVTPGKIIKAEEAERLLRQDVQRCERLIQTRITRVMTQNQIDALCSFIFNVGVAGFENSTLLRKINESPTDPTIRAQFARWVHGDWKDGKDNNGNGIIDEPGEKAPLPGLVARRKREADLYFQ